MERTIILGLAGTRSLMDIVDSCDEKNILICRHSFSISTRDKIVTTLSHNQQIENEDNCEKNYYQLLSELRATGKKISSFTQGSNYGKTLISRYSGIKLGENEDVFQGNSYDRQPTEECIQINDDLADIINGCSIKNFIIENIKTTEIRKGFYGCFLHDVKVYFVACNFDSLVKQEIIINTNLYINSGNIISDYSTSEEDLEINEFVVNKDKIMEYSRLFNNWLRDILEEKIDSIACDYVVTDPGPGHKIDGGILEAIAQDIDDTVTLKLLDLKKKPIKCLSISDETSLFSRVCFTLSNFTNINQIKIFSNNSTEKKLHCGVKILETLKNGIENDTVEFIPVCKYLNWKIMNLVEEKKKLSEEDISQFFLNIKKEIDLLQVALPQCLKLFQEDSRGGSKKTKKQKKKVKNRSKKI